MEVNNMLAYFIIYSFLGWIVESAYKTIRTKKFVNSGFLFGPFCPIYGVGALIMLIFLNQFKDNIIILFLVAIFVLSVWEYIVGILLEKIFKTKYWDYSSKKYNIHGRVCLENSFYWGILAIVFTKLVHPPIVFLLSKVPSNVVLYLNIVFTVIAIVDYIYCIIKIYNINISIDSLNEITKNIKLELEGIKKYAGKKVKESEKLKRALVELKEKRTNLRLQLEKQTERLRKAFPTMKFLKTTRYLNRSKESIKKTK